MSNEASKTGVVQKMDPKLRDMTERAERAQAQARELRATAPDVAMGRPKSNIPQRKLEAKYARMDGFKGNDDPAGMHYMFGDRDLTEQYPDEGYVPVLEKGVGGTVKQVTWQGDPMWKIPTDIYTARLEDNAARGKRMGQENAAADMARANRSGVVTEQLQTATAGSPDADRILQEAGVS